MKYFLNLILLFVLVAGSVAQQPITLEDIWKNYKFTPKSIPGFVFQNDGKHYTLREGDQINQYDLTTGKMTKTIFKGADFKDQNAYPGTLNSYEFSADESKIMLTTEEEAIYRHSTKSQFFIYDGKSVSKLYEGDKQMYATFNPAADKVAFVLNNNLYFKDLKNNQTKQITTDGEMNKIINGALDWVYEEEFSFWRGFEWSPDGKRIAFYKFDESNVPQFRLTNYYNELYPDEVIFKYPKVGQVNSVVTVWVYDLETGKTTQVETGGETDQYIPRIKWTADPLHLCVYRLNRHQNHLEFMLADAKTGKTVKLFEEKNARYISEENFDNLTFLKNGREFIWTSEMDGYSHIYLYDLKGKLVRQLTKGNWEMTKLLGIDEKNGQVYYQAAQVSPMQRELYSTEISTGKTKKMSTKAGWNDAIFSSTFDYYVNSFSTMNSPAAYSVYNRRGDLIRVIEDNKKLAEIQEAYNVQPVEFFSFETSDSVSLNGWMIKPVDFNPENKYPVFMYQYGGPGSQQVVDKWKGQDYWWFQMLAQQGFLVACVDNRGTGGRGEEFKKMTYQQLGHYETIDQIEAAKYLGSLPFADPNRIGIFGWSYGGYMSTLALLKGNDTFKAGIAVAPVTNWKWYDTIYTERFMRTEEENPDGYRENSPINFADQLKGNYLLVHGMGDDNVHFQNTVEMANALISANKQFDTYFYPNRNHGIYGDNTRLHLYTKMTNFLHEKLKNDYKPVGDVRP